LPNDISLQVGHDRLSPVGDGPPEFRAAWYPKGLNVTAVVGLAGGLGSIRVERLTSVVPAGRSWVKDRKLFPAPWSVYVEGGPDRAAMGLHGLPTHASLSGSVHPLGSPSPATVWDSTPVLPAQDPPTAGVPVGDDGRLGIRVDILALPAALAGLAPDGVKHPVG
jgi:hypothetical protein